MLTPPSALEAILFAAGEPVEKEDAAKLLGVSASELEKTAEALTAQLKDRGLALISTADVLELRTSAAAAEFVKKLRESELSRDLGKGSLETLAVIAYKGGATRGEVDWVRGVNSSASMRTLMLRGLVEGREDEKDRRRTRYSLTTKALAHLGLKSSAELPRHAELSAGADQMIATQQSAEATAD